MCAVPRVRIIGLARVFMDPPPGDDPFELTWSHRTYRARMNTTENLLIYAPLTLSVHVLDTGDATTAATAAAYFRARLLHASPYFVKTPVVRTAAYFLGLDACLVLAYEIVF